jgi:glycosyltransferase involved in cell wall biosynthesis
VRVALIPSAYAPSLGGVEELTRRLADRFAQSGAAVEVWTFRYPDTLPDRDVIDGTTVRRFDFPMPAANPAALLGLAPAGARAFAALSQAVKEFRPDILHVQCFSAQGIYATAVSARHRIPLVVTLQGETVMDDNDIYDESAALRLGLRTALRRARAVTGCSQFVIDDAVSRFGLPAGKGRVVYNGVEVAGDDVPTPVDLPFSRFVVALGRVVPKKGFDLLLEAFARISPGHPDVGLVIGGEGRSRDALLDQARTLGLEGKVAFPGRLDRGSVAWVMSHADVFCLPSRVEPFGIVVIEALRAGRPVVVSSRGGAPEIVRHEREGLVADPFDPAAYGAAIDRLLADRELAARLAAAGRERVNDFSWAKIADQYTALYRELA